MIITTTTYHGIAITTSLDEAGDGPAALICHDGIPQRLIPLADISPVRDPETGDIDIELTIAQIHHDYVRDYLAMTRQNKLPQTEAATTLAA